MAAKKSFKDNINPALQFISIPEEKPEQAEPEKAPEGYKVNPAYIETKSKRVQLLMQPSLHQKLKSKAVAEGKSLNDLIHIILEEAVKE